MGDRDVAPKRNTHSNRARPNQSRIYQHLGVRDLREIIDRKRNEQGYVNETRVPPPDPSYNYLKDPLREDANTLSSVEPTKPQNTRKHHKNFTGNFRKETSHPEKTDRDITNPLNIKVEFSTSTGEHVYKFDENTVLPTIKHVPDHTPRPSRGFRGRFRGGRNYRNRAMKNTKFEDEVVAAEVGAPGVEENWDEEPTECKATPNEEVERAEDEDLAADIENLNIDQSESKDIEADDNKSTEVSPTYN